MGLVFPVFRWGFISPVRPGSVQVGPGHRFYSFAPTKVRLVSAGLVGKEQFTKNGLGGAMENYRECVGLLARERVDIIALGRRPYPPSLVACAFATF